MRVSDSTLGVGLKARPDSSAIEHLTYKVEIGNRRLACDKAWLQVMALSR